MVERRVLTGLLQVHDLPTLPVIMTKILEMVADESSSANDLTKLLEQDHAISARILRLANSAFYGLRRPVDSIRAGVVVLGFAEVSQLALATSVFDTFSKRQQFAFDPEDFWMHALGAARAAQMISERQRLGDLREGCFTAGLLHDIGKYVLALVLKVEYKEIVDEAHQRNRLLRDIEQERLGTTHAQVGHWLAERWRFPPLIAGAIGNRYRVTTCRDNERPAAAVTAMADELSRMAHFGLAGDGECTGVDSVLLSILNITDDRCATLAQDMKALREEAVRFLHIMRHD